MSEVHGGMAMNAHRLYNHDGETTTTVPDGMTYTDAHKHGSCPVPDTAEEYSGGGTRMYERKYHDKGGFTYFGSAEAYPYPERTTE